MERNGAEQASGWVIGTRVTGEAVHWQGWPSELSAAEGPPGCVWRKTAQRGDNGPAGSLCRGLDIHSEKERIKSTIPKLLAQAAREEYGFGGKEGERR